MSDVQSLFNDFLASIAQKANEHGYTCEPKQLADAAIENLFDGTLKKNEISLMLQGFLAKYRDDAGHNAYKTVNLDM